MSHLVFPEDLDPASFLQNYWQQKPLLFRSAIPRFTCALDPDAAAGLACDETVESRLILEKYGVTPWEVRHGPFHESDFAQLGDSHWTLLMQDVDKHLPQLARLLEYFRFLPDWRVDDLMISYAVDQGSVGPHIDEYDVFLFQASGRRRWQINSQPRADAPYLSGLDLRILPDFEADREWVLEPGDMLYLPPHIAHWGVALGRAMTCSLGFRAPSYRELLSSWCDDLIERQVPNGRYQDSGLTPQTDSAEIQQDVIARVETLVKRCLVHDRDSLQRWFGRFVTEAKQHLVIEPRATPLSDQDFLSAFRLKGLLIRHAFARPSFIRGGADRDYLFVNGRDYPLANGHGAFFPAITKTRDLHYEKLVDWLGVPACVQILTSLYNDGCYLFPDE